MMIKLFRSEYGRLVKSKIFWVSVIGCTGFGICLSLYMWWMNSCFSYVSPADENVFIFSTFGGILSAVFTSLFVGKLYSDGTMRNQIIMGHSRIKIYLCEYLVSLLANVMFFVFYVIGNISVAYPLHKYFGNTPKEMLMKSLLTIAIIAVYTAIFVFIAMLNRNKAVVAIICLLSAFGLLFYSMIIESALRQPKIYEDEYYYDTEKDAIVKEEAFPNPNYVDGKKREVYEFLNDFLPAGQSFQVGGNYDEPTVNDIFFLYDSCIVLITTLGGVIVYKRKDLK